PDRTPAERKAAADRCEGLLGRAVALLEGQAAGDTRALDAALALVRRMAQRDELALAELCVGLEKWDREELRALLDEFILLLRDALVCAAGALEERDARRRQTAEEAARALSPAALSRAISTAEELRDAIGFNVGGG